MWLASVRRAGCHVGYCVRDAGAGCFRGCVFDAIGAAQHSADVDCAIGLDDHARVRGAGGDVFNVKARRLGGRGRRCLVVDTGDLQVIELDEVAFQLVVDRPQLCDGDFTGHGHVAVTGALDVEFGRQQPAAQCHRRLLADIGLKHGQVEIGEVGFTLDAAEVRSKVGLGVQLAAVVDFGGHHDGHRRGV